MNTSNTSSARELAPASPSTLPAPGDGTLAAALAYIARGWTVIPVCRATADGGCTAAALDAHKGDHKCGKEPVAKWKGRAATTTAEAAKWWGRSNPYGPNVALLCGPGGLVALDVDGPAGEATLAAAAEVLGALPPTLVNATGRGRHLLFELPASMTEAERATLTGSGASLRLDGRRFVCGAEDEGASTGLDVRAGNADGGRGYVIVAPSVHSNGARYQWTGGALATLPPAWCEALPRVSRPGPKRTGPGLPGEGEALARITAAADATSTPGPRGDVARRARARLDRALREDLATIPREAPESNTNNAIRDVTLRVMRIALATNDRAEVERARAACLAAARSSGHPEGACVATVASSAEAAEKYGPAPLPERERPQTGRRPSEAAGQGEGVPLPPDDGRPRIVVGPDLHRVVGEAVAVLGAHPEVYQRRGVGLVRILAAPSDWQDPGAPIIDPLPRPVLAPMLSEVAMWAGRTRKGELRQVQPPDTVTAAVHAAGVYPATVRPLRGIVEAPTLRRDGTLVTARGYDAATGLFVHWQGAELDVPERPSRLDARDAFARLAKLFADFRFAGDASAQNIARAGVVAAMLSPLAREAVDGPCPAFVFEADGPNAGKTLAASVCGALVTGRVPAVRQHTADDDETAKRLASIAIAGHPVALFDNVREHVQGGALEAALSAHSTIAARILGRSEDRELPWRTVLFLTMNAASYSADVARRVVHIAMRGRAVDLDAPAEHFAINDLARHVLGHRAELLRDAFTILRAHQLAGRPHDGATLPTFEAWSRVVAAAVCWASGHDPVRARPPESANRDADVARRVALAWCSSFPSGEALRVGKALELVRGASADRPGANGPARADALSALRDALADLAGASDPGRITPGSLGKLLASRVVGKVFVDPTNAARRVSVEAATLEHGSMRYRGCVEAPATETPVIPSDHPDDDDPQRGGYGDKGGYGKRRKEESQTAEDTSNATETWDA